MTVLHTVELVVSGVSVLGLGSWLRWSAEQRRREILKRIAGEAVRRDEEDWIERNVR